VSAAVLAAIGSAAVLLGFLTAIIGLVNQRNQRKTAALAEQTAGKVQQISVQVDGRLSTLLERQSQLLDALHESGTPIPPRPPDAPPTPPGGPA
jgi:hypothetical protein